jgi:Na+/proline symporter
LFIWEHLPPGIAGLIIAAILAAAMSNLSAALNSLASTTVMDFWRDVGRTSGSAASLPAGSDAARRPRADQEVRPTTDAVWLRRARLTTVVWAAVLLAVALLARNWGSVLQAGLSIASIIYGSLLGVFLLGLLTRRVGEIAAMCGMVAALAVMLYVRFATTIAFTWYVLIGTSAAFAVGVAVSYVVKEEAHG